ncbi:MAG: TetR family transcriptional regulator [Solirubrobacterales bacterium]|nr:TetR family transcriptional regulator [Solirubrobacterales bacterium]
MIEPTQTVSDRPHRTQTERRQATRQALVEAALLRIQAGENFDTLSLRSLSKAAGVVPAAFYRHFDSLEDLGMALMDDSFRALRAMLRDARRRDPKEAIPASISSLTEHVQANRPHFAFIAQARSSGSPRLRATYHAEIRLIVSELATDLARFPHMSKWSAADLQMVSSLIVNSMISTTEAILETRENDVAGRTAIAKTAEHQLRLVMIGVPQWRSATATEDPA